MKLLPGWPPLRRLTSVSAALRVVAVAVLTLVGGAAYYEATSTRRSVIAETERQLARLDMVFAEQAGRAVEAVDLLVSSALESAQLHLIQGTSMESDNHAPLAEMLHRRIGAVRQLSAIAVVDGSGRTVVSTQRDDSLTPPSLVLLMLDRYRGDTTAGLLISSPFQTADGRWFALLTRPMTDAGGRLMGMAIGTIVLSYFEEFYRAVELSENGAINLHLRDGTVLARFPHVDNVIGTSFGDLPPFKDVLSKSIAGTLVMDSPVDGSTRIVAVRALKAFPLAVMVSVDQKRILIDWRHGAIALTGVAVALGGAVAILLLTLAKRSMEIERLLDQASDARAAAEDANDRLVQQIAERERAEGALRQAQRIEAIGQLTGGVAHDFNNLLAVVLGNIELLQRRGLPGDANGMKRLEAIRSAAQRGATLTGHLLSFARRQPLMPRPVDLNAAIRGMHDLMDSALGMRAQVRLNLAPDLWPAIVDQSQVELVILNLVINARDAMQTAGIVTIETMNYHRAAAGVPDGPAAGDYARFIVHDTGCGMPPDVLARVFEPFFTTKPPGAGSGLGLSQVFGTARQSGGEVRIESAVGKGTSVIVDLPRARTQAATAPENDLHERLIGSNATILLVDDEDAVRGVAATMLRDLGYNVREADSGNAALAILEQEAGIDVLLTDLVMPEMNGAELAVSAVERLPGLSVVFLTGYADPLGDALTLNHRLIRKPFNATELYRGVEEVLAVRRNGMAEVTAGKAR